MHTHRETDSANWQSTSTPLNDAISGASNGPTAHTEETHKPVRSMRSESTPNPIAIAAPKPGGSESATRVARKTNSTRPEYQDAARRPRSERH